MLDEERGLYIISVASRLLSMHPQTLRKYERAGFLIPNRTDGALRLYSAEDIQRLQLIKHLVDTLGLNLAGVELGLKLVSLLGQVQEDLEHLPEGAEVPKRVRKNVEHALALLGVEPEPQEPQPPRNVRVRHYVRTPVRRNRAPDGEGQEG